jgi:tyrosine-specific transport protein
MGIRTVDYVNRGLMIVKFGAYILLVLMMLPFVSKINLLDGDMRYLTSATAITVTITSFGYAAIVPSLRIYFAGDVAKLKKAILIGSLVPLFCYIAWDLAIMGVLPLGGEHGLTAILHSERSTSDLVNALSSSASSSSVTLFARLFTSVCVLTSFLGVALCLVDFWADGLQLEKKGANKLIISLITFIPPLLIVLFKPGIFVKALEYAGIDCIILLIILPVWMAWSGRYRRGLTSGYTVPGGKPLLIGLVIFSFIIMIKSMMP